MGNVYNSGMIKGKLNVGQGKDGISAYEVALNNGFEGTEQEWLESIKGEKGDTGNSGVYVGSGEMPEDCNVQIDPNGDVVDFGGQIATVEQINDLDAAIKNLSATVEQKNDKTHWIEKVPNERTFLEENTFTATLNSGGLGVYKWTDNVNKPYKLLPNSKYTIVFDDVAYEYEISETVPTNIGNMQLGDETVEGEPFRCTFNKSGMYINIFVLDEEPHKISIIETTYTDVYHKIDKNFLPFEEITLALTTDDGNVKHYVLYGREVVE
jgi:hypothetical protein